MSTGYQISIRTNFSPDSDLPMEKKIESWVSYSISFQLYSDINHFWFWVLSDLPGKAEWIRPSLPTEADERRNIMSHKWFTFTFCISCNFETISFKKIHGEAETRKRDCKEIIYLFIIYFFTNFHLPPISPSFYSRLQITESSAFSGVIFTVALMVINGTLARLCISSFHYLRLRDQ